MARSLGYLWAAGATLLMLTLVLPHGTDHNVGWMLAVAGEVYVMAGVMLFVRGLPVRVFEGFIALATLEICAIVVLSRSTASAYAWFLTWLAVHAFYFLPWRRALPQLALIGVAYAVALVITPAHGDGRAVRYAMTMGTLVVTAAFVGLLKARIDRLVLRLSDAARRDFLTKLLNRRGFEDAFELELERVQRGDRPLSLLVLDVDHFKHVNDAYGHHVGDETLTKVALALDGTRRRIDSAARTGGEEFALLLPDTDGSGAFLMAERVRAQVSATTDAPTVTVSIGIASFPVDGRDASSLMKAADQALYAAKGLGRDRAIVYSPELTAMVADSERRTDGQHLATVLTLAAALDARDEKTAEHSRTVARYAQLTATELGLAPDRVDRIRLAGLVHDVGKIGIRDTILHKPGPLDAAEWEQMRKHPEIGARLLVGDDLADLSAWIVAHHEWLDGRGYPNALTAPDIPLESRILAVADAFEAMTTDRIYRPALGVAAATAELHRGSGTQFDARVVAALLAVVDREGAVAAPPRAA